VTLREKIRHGENGCGWDRAKECKKKPQSWKRNPGLHHATSGKKATYAENIEVTKCRSQDTSEKPNNTKKWTSSMASREDRTKIEGEGNACRGASGFARSDVDFGEVKREGNLKVTQRDLCQI